MSRIFISHSSKDNGAALALAEWLRGEGWNDFFLDLDPERGITAGERWERALMDAAHRCEAVIFLISPSWLTSHWCNEELQLARRLNKRLFGLLIAEINPSDLPPSLSGQWQTVDLTGGSDHGAPIEVTLPDGKRHYTTFSASGLTRVKSGLRKANLDPGYFHWPPAHDPGRAPYRGMHALEADDAGIFFGRDGPIVEVLDRRRGLRAGVAPRMLAILGASGSGKSSLLQAGILPRLERDDRNFVVLPPIRPGRLPLTGLITSLEQAIKARGLRLSRARIEKDIVKGGNEAIALLEKLIADGSTSDPALTNAISPSLVIPLDQGEELFTTSESQERDRFLALLRDLVTSERIKAIVLVTIRSDSYEPLQTTPALEGITQETYSLAPMPKGTFQSVVEGPAQRLKASGQPLRIDPLLTQKLLGDLENGGGKDVLPLLAFTMERLYRRHGGDGDLTLDEYNEMGGLAGAIEEAVEQALARADADPAIPRERAARLGLIRRAMIPWLAGIDPETGAPRRRSARLSDIPAEARALVAHLVDERLLTSAKQPGASETMLEPAHEALLRQWGALRGWLKEDQALLAILDMLKRAARDWQANAYDPAWLAHRGGRLESLRALMDRSDLAAMLEERDRAYLDAALEQERSHLEQEQRKATELASARERVITRTRLGAITAILLACVAGAFAWYALAQADRAARGETEARQAAARLAVDVAFNLIERQDLDAASQLLVSAAAEFDTATAPDVLPIALHQLLEARAGRERIAVEGGMTALEGGVHLYFLDANKTSIWAYEGGSQLEPTYRGQPGDRPILEVVFTLDSSHAVVLRDDYSVWALDLADRTIKQTGQLAVTPEDLAQYEADVTIHPAGKVILDQFETVDSRAVFILDALTGRSRTGSVESGFWEYAETAAGGVLVGNDRIYEVALESPDRHFQLVSTASEDVLARRLDNCFARGGALGIPPDAKLPESRNEIYLASSICRTTGDGFIWSRDIPSSAGGFTLTSMVRADEAELFFGSDGQRYAVDPDQGPERVAVRPGGDFTELAFSYGRTVSLPDLELPQRWSYDGDVTAIHFPDADRLAVFNATGNEIIVHNLERTAPRLAIIQPASDDVSPQYTPLNAAVCGTGRRLDGQVLEFHAPDGAILNLTPKFEESLSVALVEPSGPTNQLLLPAATECLHVSSDWSRILLQNASGLEIHDLKLALSSDGVSSVSWISSVPGVFSSAYFAGGTDALITTNYGYTINRWAYGPDGSWTAETVFRGNGIVSHAEPDAQGRSLLLTEQLAHGIVRLALYSISAEKIAMDLGSDYKWNDATFAADGDIRRGYSTFPTDIVHIPTLDELLSELAN